MNASNGFYGFALWVAGIGAVILLMSGEVAPLIGCGLAVLFVSFLIKK